MSNAAAPNQERRSPIFSLALATKNALPQLEKAIGALKRQTYKQFELIVQDGGSTDGTLEYLASVKNDLHLDLASQPDSGIGQAYNRALQRCRGDYVCFLSADEYLDDDALEKALACFRTYPDAAIVYGGMRLANTQEEIVETFFPRPFELLRVLTNEIVPPMAATFLNRHAIGNDLYYDESLKTCPDYDFWLRLGCRLLPTEIICVQQVFLTALADRTSMTYRAESYEQFCRDKIFALNRLLDSQATGPLVAALRRSGTAGILMWAAESVFQLTGVSALFLKLCMEASRFDGSSSRLLALTEKSKLFRKDVTSGHLIVNWDLQPERPLLPTQTVGLIRLAAAGTLEHWQGAATEKHGDTIEVITGPGAWGYASEIPLVTPECLDEASWYWIKIDAEVLKGEVGVGILSQDQLVCEKLLVPQCAGSRVFLELHSSDARSVIVRNGSVDQVSIVRLTGASLVCCPKGLHIAELQSSGGDFV